MNTVEITSGRIIINGNDCGPAPIRRTAAAFLCNSAPFVQGHKAGFCANDIILAFIGTDGVIFRADRKWGQYSGAEQNDWLERGVIPASAATRMSAASLWEGV